MSREATGAARPYSAFRLVFMPTSGTLATCSSFGASEAQDVSNFRFVGEVVDILAVLPQSHALIVMTTMITGPNAVRIADEETSYLVLNTEVNDLSCGLVSHIAHTSLYPSARLVFGPLQLLPPMRILCAVGLLLGKFAHALIALAFQGTDTAPSHNHRLACVGTDSSKMDFTEVYRGMSPTRGLLCLGNLNTDMQLKPSVPHQRTRPTLLRQLDRKHDASTPTAHWQHDTPTLFRDSLSRPHHGIESLRFPGIFHLWGSRLKLPSGLDIGKEGMHDHLNRLAVQGKCAFGGFLQVTPTRPFGMRLTSGFMGLHAEVPDLCCLHLSRFEALEHRMREMIESVDFYGVHGYNDSMETSGLQVGKTRYTHYSIAYHLVWIPKYRRKILTGDVQAETKRLIVECCERHGLTLLALETDIDHIHVFVSAPPRFSPALIANLLKGHSSRYLREKFPRLKKVCGKEHLWTSSYYVGTAGAVSAETIKRYIMDCQGK